MINKLLSTLNIRAGEGKNTSLLIGMMLFSAAGYTLGGTGIEALYFARSGTALLPYLYMGLGMLSLVTTLAITGLLGRVKRERMYVLIPLAAAVFLLVAWGLLFSTSRIVFPALWLGKESLNTITSMIAWNTAGAVCDSRQAKRLFPLFNGARILGSVLGGLGTGVMVDLIGTQNLVLVWAISMSLVFGMSRALMGGKVQPAIRGSKSRVRRGGASFISEMQKGWDYVRRSELLRWMSLAAILFSVLYFSVALPFSKSVTAQYPDEKELAGFLGLFNGLSTAAAFGTSIFFANRMYARFGIMNMILALPLIYLLGFSTLAFLDVFAMIVAFRFVQMLWLSGVADAAYQTMFSAIPPEKRDQVNAFLNGVPEQAGVFLAGGILIIGEYAFTSQQLYMIGLIAAVATTYIIWRASSAYRRALVASLREGRPTVFSGRATTRDSTSLAVALENIKHADPLVRRVSAEMLGEMKAYDVLVPILHDENADVRMTALQGLTHHPPASSQISALLADPEPAVRTQAVRTLRHLSHDLGDLQGLLTPLLKDKNTHVQMETALGLLKTGMHSEARALINARCVDGELDERVRALNALSELGDHEASALIVEQLEDSRGPIRRAAALALASCGRDAIPALITALADEDSSVREGAALGLAGIGETSRSTVVAALNDAKRVDGALLALSYLPPAKNRDAVRHFATGKIESALYYHEAAGRIKVDSDRSRLLIDSLQSRAKQDGLYALRALSLLSQDDGIQAAIENLQNKEATQRANALETLDAAQNSRLIKPLLPIWEAQESRSSISDNTQETKDQLLNETDAWIRACAIFAFQGEIMDTRNTLPIMERVLFLRRVPLLADLSPSDLQRVAALATEHHAEMNEVIFEQGDDGDAMYIIVHGEVKVMVRSDDQLEKEFARREPGDVVGEMSIISGEPRIAGLIAAEETHLLCLDKKSFEAVLRERPEVSLAIMRVLCARLKEATK